VRAKRVIAGICRWGFTTITPIASRAMAPIFMKVER